MVRNWFKITVEQEMEKNPRLTRDMIEEMKLWAKEQPHLPPLEDMDMVLFLHACNFDVEVAKKTLDINYTIRTKCILFKGRDPLGQDIASVREVVKICLMKERDDEGCGVMAGMIIDPDVSKYNPLYYAKNAFMLLDMYHLELGTGSGLVAVLSLKNMTFRHLLTFPLSHLKIIFAYIQEGITIKIKAIHFVNTKGSIVEPLMSLCKPFLKASLLEVIHFHPGLDTLQEHLSPKCIPNDFGGSAGGLEELSDEEHQMMVSYKEYFEEEALLRVDESKRPKKDKSKFFGWF